ncbi:MAG TPA: flavoprotein [Mycobacterium sp.]|nr:flavoprotein [Mycobacterium sp.]
MRRIIVAITGASGAIYGVRALETLGKVEDVETHLVVTSSGQRTVRSLADHHHHPRDIGAAVSSGSFVTTGMLVAPCSVKTLSGIANSYNDELVVRAADVCLKERRRVDLMARGDEQRGDHHAARSGVLCVAALSTRSSIKRCPGLSNYWTS